MTTELPPGDHFVELRLRGHRDAREPFALPADESLALSIELLKAPESGLSAPAEPPPIRTEEGGATWLLPTSIAVGGAGVLTLGASLVLELMRSGAEDDARAAELQVDAAAAYDRMSTFETAARVTVGVGGGLALVGAVMLIVDLAVERDPSVGVACSFIGCGFGARF